jgi:diaminopimelate decarboxylase
MPQARPGDLIGVAMSGSYGLTASPLLFLGHDTPVELVLDRGNIIVGRTRHTLEDFN